MYTRSMQDQLTRNNVPRIDSFFVLDKSEAVHDLDFLDGTRSILEVIRNVLLSDCRPRDQDVSNGSSTNEPRDSAMKDPGNEILQVQVHTNEGNGKRPIVAKAQGCE